MKNRNFRSAFSLMEMMVVLLIVAIIAAATAPMVTKKMARSVGSGDSPWVFTGLNNNIAYNMGGNDNATAIIGASSLPSGWDQHTRLFIDSGDNASHIAFGNGNTTPMLLTVDPNGRVGFSDAEIPAKSVAFGTGQSFETGASNIVAVGIDSKAAKGGTAVGDGARALGLYSTAVGFYAGNYDNNKTGMSSVSIGENANATGQDAIALGTTAIASKPSSIAIGSYYNPADVTKTKSEGFGSIAIGGGAVASGSNSIAIGVGTGSVPTKASYNYSVAIGSGAKTTTEHQIVLGTNRDTVYIPGKLVVAGDVGFCGMVYLTPGNKDQGRQWVYLGTDDYKGGDDNFYKVSKPSFIYSDRRLKNVGEKYTAGLEELKKLDFYHFTFKADKDNTPFVGVIAQDLQKVFPDAVTKDESGYLRIRIEDMFYAVINAVKELDTKVSQLVADVTGISSKVDEQQKVIEAQQQKIDELEKANADFEKRLAKLEKKNK